MMQPMKKMNCIGLCQQIYCSNKHTHYEYIEINGMEIVVALCSKCSNEWDEAQNKVITDNFNARYKKRFGKNAEN